MYAIDVEGTPANPEASLTPLPILVSAPNLKSEENESENESENENENENENESQEEQAPKSSEDESNTEQE